MKNHTKFLKGKKALSLLLAMVMVFSVVSPMSSVLGVTSSAAASNANGAYATVITASDFQDGRSGNLHEETFSTMLQKAKAAGVNEPDGFILGGDYDGSYANEHDTPTAYRRVESVITSAYPYFNKKNIVGIQGNHDINDPSVIDKTGPHEYEDYIVYVINNSDYPAGTGGTAAKNKTMDTAQNLEAYFNELKAEGETRPIFIATHIPLHHNARNPKANNKDANGNVVSTGWNETLYGRVLFDVINENAKIFDIVFLFGHNHSGDYDDYIGGSVNYIGKGETIRIADYTQTPSATSYTDETLNFTYMNYGYVGYSNNVVDNTLTMNTFEICPDKIVATRYSTAGQYNEAKIIDRNMKTDSPSVYVDAYNEATVGSATGVVAIASGFEDPAFTWTSSNEGVAKISGSDKVAKIMYNAAGTATIKVKVTERGDSTKTAIYNYDVVVTENTGSTSGAAIYRVKEQVDGRELEYYQIDLGDTVALSGSYKGLTENASTSWDSSNTNVAKVNQFGLVTFVGTGTANITYTVTDNTVGDEGTTYSAQVKLVVSTEKKVEYKYVQTNTITAGKSYVIASDYNSDKAIYSDRTATHNEVVALSGTPTAFEGSAGSYSIQLNDESFVWTAVKATSDNQVYLQNADSGLYLAAYATGTNDAGEETALGYFELTKAKQSNGIWQYSNNILQTTEGLKWYTRSNGIGSITSGTGRETIIFEQVPLDPYVNIEFAGEVVNGKTEIVYLAVNGRQFQLESDYVNIQQLGSEAWTSSNTNVATIDSNGVVTFKGVEGETVITYTATDAVNGKTVTASFTLSAHLTAETTRLFKYTENVVPGKKYVIVNKTDAGSFANAISSFEITYTKLLADRLNVTVEDGASYIEIPEQLNEVVWSTESAGGSAFYLKSEDNGKYIYANTDGTYDSYNSLISNVFTSASYATNTEQYKWTYEGNGKLSNQFAYTDVKLGEQTKTYLRVRSAEFLGTSTESEAKLYFFEEIASKPKAVITSRFEVLGETVERTEICPFQTEQLLPAAEHFPDDSKVSFEWSSNNALIATIDQNNGKITYTGKEGKVTITLTATSQVQDSTGAYPVATTTVVFDVIGGVGYVDPFETVYTENAFYKTTRLVPGRRYVFHAIADDGLNVAISNENKNDAHVRLLCETIDAPQTDNVGEYVTTTNPNVIWECVDSDIPGYVYLINVTGAGSAKTTKYMFASRSTASSNKNKNGVLLKQDASDHLESSSLDYVEETVLLSYNSQYGMIQSKQIVDRSDSSVYGIGNVDKSSSGGYYYMNQLTTSTDSTNRSFITLYEEPVQNSSDEEKLPDGDVYVLADNFVLGNKYVIANSNVDGAAKAVSNLTYDSRIKGDDVVVESASVGKYIANPSDSILVFEAVESGTDGYVKLKTEDDKYLVGSKSGTRTANIAEAGAYDDSYYLFKYSNNRLKISDGSNEFFIDNANNQYRCYISSAGTDLYLYALVERTDEPDTPVEDNTPVITEIRKQDDFGSVDITRVMQYRYDVNAGDTEQILRYIRGLASGYEVEWSVSDTTIATIDENGLLTYKGKTGYVDVILTVTGEDFAGNPVTRTLKTTFNVGAEQNKTRIAIPETVYMAPVNGASTVGQVYVNNVMNPDDSYNIKTVAERVDDMYFGLRVVGAKSFTVSVSNATDPSNDINLYTSAGAAVSESTSFNFDSNGVFENDGGYSLRFSGAGLQPGEKTTAKWEITVTMNDGVSKQIYTFYTVMYAPQRTVGATAEARQVDNSQNEIISWITGANGVDHAKWSPIGTFHADKSAAGYFKQDPLYNQNPPTNSTGETANDLINVVVEYPAENTRYENAYVVQAATDGNDDSFAKSYLGLLTVDKSRYTNTNQIPNLKIGYDALRRGGWKKDSFHTYANYYTLGTEKAFETTDMSAVPGSDWTQERYFTNFAESHSLPERFTIIPSYNVSDIDGKYIHVLNKGQAIQDFWAYQEREYSNAATSVLCTVTDKSTLRERVVSGYNITDGSAEFNDALMKAATVLGDPAATQEEIDKTSRELYESMAEKADVYYALKYDNLFSAFEYAQFANSMKVVGNYGTASYLNGTITVVNDTLSGANEAYTEYGSGSSYYNVELKPNTEYVFEYDVTTSLNAQAFMFFYNSSGGNADIPTNMSVKVNDGEWTSKTEKNSWWGNYTNGAGTYHYVIKFTTGPNTVKAGFRFGNTSSSPVESTFYNIKLIDSAHYYEDAQYSKTESTHKEYTSYGSLITPVRPGYVFTGWKDINGSTVTGANSATEHLTVYSQWDEVHYTVKFNGNGGAGSTSSATLSLNQPAKLPGDFARDNHTLLGWSFNDDATTADFKVGEEITVEDAHDYIDNKNQVTLYAVWERNYSVYYSANGGRGTVDHTYNPRSQAHILPDDSTLSWERHVFLGWALEPDATEPNFLPGEEFYVGEIPSQYVNETKQEVILHAVWKLDEWVVDDTVVVDFGLPVKINILANDPKAANGTLFAIGKGVESDVIINTDGYTSSKLTDVATELELENGTAKIVDGKIVYTPASTNFTEEETFYYEFKTNDGKYYYTTVTVIPATSLYFEESFMLFKDSDLEAYKWEQVGDPIENMVQSEDRPGTFTIEDADANNVYGTDDAYDSSTTYSMGSAMFVDVDKGAVGHEPSAEFTFTGTGFDLFSVTDNTAGTIRVYIYKDTDGDGDLNDETKHYKNYIVNTYYGYEYKDGAYNPIPPVRDGDGKVTNPNALFQVPVFSMRNIDTTYGVDGYGTYKVVIKPMYSSGFDVNKEGHYGIYVDAVRIFDPMGKNNATANEAYMADGEYAPNYLELRDTIIASNDWKDIISGVNPSLDGSLFFDGSAGNTDEKFDYKAVGPKNEVYLARGQAIAFNISAANVESIGSIQLGMKLLNNSGNAYVSVMNATDKKPDTIVLKSATEQFYKIDSAVEWNGNTTASPIVITNTSTEDVVISLTSVKWGYKNADNGAEVAEFSLFMDEQSSVLAYSAMERAMADPVDPIAPENIDIETPETVYIEDGKGEIVIKTEPEVEKITVDGVEITDYTVDEDGRRVWKHTFDAEELGETMFRIVAYDYDGNHSMTIISRTTVIDMDGNDGSADNGVTGDGEADDGTQNDGSSTEGIFSNDLVKMIFDLIRKLLEFLGGAFA